MKRKALFQIYTVLEEKAKEHNKRLYTPNIPIGCETFEEDDIRYCKIEWPGIEENNESVCNISQNGQTVRNNCGYTLWGYTYKGYANQTESWQSSIDNKRFSDGNDTYTMDIVERFIHHIEVEKDSDGWDFKIKFGSANLSAGHQLWKGYRLPVVSVSIIKL